MELLAVGLLADAELVHDARVTGLGPVDDPARALSGGVGDLDLEVVLLDVVRLEVVVEDDEVRVADDVRVRVEAGRGGRVWGREQRREDDVRRRERCGERWGDGQHERDERGGDQHRRWAKGAGRVGEISECGFGLEDGGGDDGLGWAGLGWTV